MTTPRLSVQRVVTNLPEAVNNNKITITADGQSHQRESWVGVDRESDGDDVFCVMYNLLVRSEEGSED
jgi:hypothetical protein